MHQSKQSSQDVKLSTKFNYAAPLGAGPGRGGSSSSVLSPPPPPHRADISQLLSSGGGGGCSPPVKDRGGSDLGVAGQILLGADDGHVGNQHLWRLEDGDEIKVLVLGPGATESGLLESGPW